MGSGRRHLWCVLVTLRTVDTFVWLCVCTRRDNVTLSTEPVHRSAVTRRLGDTFHACMGLCGVWL